MSLGTILLIVLILMLLGAIPTLDLCIKLATSFLLKTPNSLPLFHPCFLARTAR